LVKFGKNDCTFDKDEKKNAIVATIVIHRLKEVVAPFKRGGGKNPMSSITLG
jgi:hypothetical protein